MRQQMRKKSGKKDGGKREGEEKETSGHVGRAVIITGSIIKE